MIAHCHDCTCAAAHVKFELTALDAPHDACFMMANGILDALCTMMT